MSSVLYAGRHGRERDNGALTRGGRNKKESGMCFAD